MKLFVALTLVASQSHVRKDALGREDQERLKRSSDFLHRRNQPRISAPGFNLPPEHKDSVRGSRNHTSVSDPIPHNGTLNPDRDSSSSNLQFLRSPIGWLRYASAARGS
jgi:hypothetical protein